MIRPGVIVTLIVVMLTIFTATPVTTTAAGARAAVVYSSGQIDSACGHAGDVDGVPESDGYRSASWTVNNANTGSTVTIGGDIAWYRVPWNGQCYRSYYGSVWTYDRSSAQGLTSHLRAWTCGTPRADFQQVANNTWGRAVVAYHLNQTWSNGTPWGQLTFATNTPDGHTWLLDYDNYTNGFNLCGPQTDNAFSSVYDQFYFPEPVANCCTMGPSNLYAKQ